MDWSRWCYSYEFETLPGKSLELCALAVLLEAHYYVRLRHLTFTLPVIPSWSDWSLQQRSEPCSITIQSIRYVLLLVLLSIQQEHLIRARLVTDIHEIWYVSTCKHFFTSHTTTT